MKTLVVLASLAASTMFAQDAKMVSKDAPPTVAPADRPLTEAEVLKWQNAGLNITLLLKEYKIDDYLKAVEPHQRAKQELAEAACASIGVPKDKVQSECGFSDGTGPDGKPLMGADGKPTPAHVWRIVASPAPTPNTKPEGK